MNKQRRKALNLIINDLEKTKAAIETFLDKEEKKPETKKEEKTNAEKLEDFRGQAADAQSQLETLRDEEQEYFDNMPEGLQGGDKGSAAEEAISNLDEAIGYAEELVDQFDEAIKAEAEEEIEEALDGSVDKIDDAIGSIESSMEG